MKYILLITMHADPAMAPGYEEWGGTHTYMKELMDSFEKRKIHCIVVTRKSMPLPDVESYNEFCTVYRLKNGEIAYMDKTLLQHYHSDNLSKIQKIIDQYGKPIVIHSVYWNSGRLAMELAEQNSVHFVHSVISNSRGRVFRGATEPVPTRTEYEQQIYNKATWILCVSNDEKEDLINFYKIKPDKICVVGQFIHEAFLLPSHDDNGFPRLNSKINYEQQKQIASVYNNIRDIQTTDLYWNRKVFTYMGRMSLYKGVDHILNAWYQLYRKYKELCPALWMVGGSIKEITTLRKDIKKQIKELDKIEQQGQIIWWGYLDAAGLSTILLKSHLMLAHSQYEPGGRVVVEAMSEGVPVIATPNGFAKDYIKNWQNGFLVAYGDVKKLFLRMEHFIRQPFLSNALGQNARKDAKEIIKKWNFLDNHLMAYGLETEEGLKEEKKENIYDYFKMRDINLFPYYNIPLSKEYLKNKFEEITGHSAKNIQMGIHGDYTSHIIKVSGDSGNFIFKQYYNRLAITAIVNPFGKDIYIRQASRHFELELNIYKRTGANVLIGYDEIHQLILLRELSSGNYSNPEFLSACIHYIMTRNEIANPNELDLFYTIMKGRMETYQDIQDIYANLNKYLPTYYFEVSGLFYGKLGWAESQFILNYNADYIEKKLFHRLQEIATLFNSITFIYERKGLQYINTDTELKHFMIDGKEIRMIDFEKSAIGYKENEIASILYDYLLHYSSRKNIEEVLDYVPIELNKQIILIDMAYRAFYDIQVNCVMNCKSTIQYVDLLEMLYQKAYHGTK